ncbi:MAG: 4-alpha-glucanotransferase [Xanthobacteraceae bacterium]
MTDTEVERLARQAGIAVQWTDAAGQERQVAPDVLRPILQALGLPCGTPADLAGSRERLDRAHGHAQLPPLITADVGTSIALPRGGAPSAARARLQLEDGTRQDVVTDGRGDQLVLGPIRQPGYHRFDLGDHSVTLAVAPTRCTTVDDIATHRHIWGIAAQVYGLRRHGDGGIGDTAGVRALADAAAREGADALALSPVHALFGADPSRFGPYSPSSRLFLNPLHADPGVLFGEALIAVAIHDAGLDAEWTRLESADLVDWPAAARAKLAVLRRLFDRFATSLDRHGDDALAGDFAGYRRAGGDLLEQHARFEALHAARLAADRATWSWRTWPIELQHPDGPAVSAFAAEQAREITFQVFLQWVADRSMAAAQAHARHAGMRIGLIADLAVGMDSAGSHAWSRQRDLVVGLNVGAPPDLFNPLGQEWGLTTFSPQALVEGGFAPFLATLRAAMRHAGGVRIDHAMGLARLWLVPEGAPPADGAYLRYPLQDLVRLIKLESVRHRAIVIGEDLGTVPAGFRDTLGAAGIAGMSVLWFQRDEDDFMPPEQWPARNVAMTTTHDLPTVAGWWRGVDIDLRTRLGRPGAGAREPRDADRKLLWGAFRAAGAAAGPKEPPTDPGAVVDAAVRFIARTPAHLALLPLEDALGLEAQPNLPGTVDEYPNWRRRYPGPADQMLDAPQVRARARALTRRSHG